MKYLLIALVAVIPHLSHAKQKEIDWLPSSPHAQSFWEEGTYRTVENSQVVWLENLPTQYPKLKAFSRTEWFEEQKVLKEKSLFKIGSDYRLSARKVGPNTISFLYIKGRSKEYGEGWAVFIGNKRGTDANSAEDNITIVKELWTKDSWATREINVVRQYRIKGTENRTYRDDKIRALVTPDSESIGLLITNESDETIKIDWNESSVIDTSGFSSSIITEGTRLIERNKELKPSFVPPKANYNTSITPSKNIHWFDSSGTWYTKPLIYEHEDFGVLHIYLAIYEGDKKVNRHIEIEFNTTRIEPTI